MINYKKLKEIKPEYIGNGKNRCYNCPTKIVLKELFKVDVHLGCKGLFWKNILPLIPEKHKRKINVNYCPDCRKGAIIVYGIATKNNKI